MTIKRNPLGIRKLDVQKKRREHYAEGHTLAQDLANNLWFPEGKPISRDEMIRFAMTMYSYGWEVGVAVGAEATRARVKEALENGNLVKP